ncbi:MAG: nucleoside deaminase [Spirochaetia bacterium]|jgi:guanine deaminase|nr:nucleoside deaminase [Spirochaetia bacterium]
MNAQEILSKAVEEARQTVDSNLGGPFGAALVDETGKVFLASNTVLGSCDPTAHAEVNAIRKACEEKQSHDLSGCKLYTTCYPCPMCLAACIWANIKEVHYGCTAEDAKKIGFRDDYIYDFFEGHSSDASVIALHAEDKEACLALFKHYQKQSKQLY